MGYRLYLGYINKSDLKRIQKEVLKLQKLIGKPKSKNTDEVYTKYDVTKYMKDQSTYIISFDKVYQFDNNALEKLLYNNVFENFSSEDTEFYLLNPNEKHFFYKLSVAYQSMYVAYCKKVNEVLEKILKNNKRIKLNERDKEILEIAQQTNTVEINYCSTAERKINNDIYGFEPFNKYQFNYIAVQLFLKLKDENFDYENKILCFYGN